MRFVGRYSDCLAKTRIQYAGSRGKRSLGSLQDICSQILPHRRFSTVVDWLHLQVKVLVQCRNRDVCKAPCAVGAEIYIMLSGVIDQLADIGYVNGLAHNQG